MMHLLFHSRFLKKSVFSIIRASTCTIIRQPVKTKVLRSLCSSIPNDPSKDYVNGSKNANWKPIYIFPLIHIARLINRLKLYQTVFTVAILPLTIGLYYYDECNFSTVLIVSGATTFTCVSLYIMTAFFKRLIGVIYMDESKTKLKIAHLTFWGNRKDIMVPIEDIIPLTDSNCSAKDAFVKMQRYSTEEILYLTLRFGKFLEKDDFQKVFGNFELLGLKN